MMRRTFKTSKCLVGYGNDGRIYYLKCRFHGSDNKKAYVHNVYTEYLILKLVNSSHFAIAREVLPLDNFGILVTDYYLKLKCTKNNIDFYLKELILGIKALHRIGIVHRNLSLEHLRINIFGRLVITGLGKAEIQHLPQSNIFNMCKGRKGDARYAAPEEFTGECFDGRKSDLWSCGIIYMKVFIEEFLWESAELHIEKYKKYFISRNRRKLFSKISYDAHLVMGKILDPNPVTRITIEELMESMWFKNR
ncbi:Serine/threonine-protein kinase hal4 [Astathelohania contejeani]|uniref:non-specific serine/threonine protein kinase n=1 Tax=Astathelohania contejeani TaxID=164912 RepID=A0ABQ7I0K8_9MICR|nr:Serine/threonine-protein kinase hal4 [Thelohania contejeani]